MSDTTMLTADEAIAAIERCAFLSQQPGGSIERRIVHCFVRGMGADWDAESAIQAVRNAYVHEGEPQIAWADTMFGRCLVVLEADPSGKGGRSRTFDTVIPEDQS